MTIYKQYEKSAGDAKRIANEIGCVETLEKGIEADAVALNGVHRLTTTNDEADVKDTSSYSVTDEHLWVQGAKTRFI